MKVLVTGGAGFIGSHLVRQLLAAGNEVTVLDNVSTGDWGHLPAGCEEWEMDIRSQEIIPRIMKARFDAIVHLAAQTMVNVSIDDPAFDAMQNVVGTVNVLEAARKSEVGRVIFASTAAGYGDVAETELPIKEQQALQPMSFYGLSKVTVEKYLAMYKEVFGLDYVVLRFANVYGERQGDTGEGGVISIFAKRVAAGKGITIYGDGEQTRDFIYAGDIAAGICAALATENVNAVYNLSTSTETSLNELVKIMEDITWKKVDVSYGAVRTGDIRRSVLDNSMAVQNLGWKPQTSLKKGLKNTIGYFKGE
ncbi:MAG: GDP-mannose 4,6-dehydratase [Selenomonas sp.]|uniref:NAD-dependent epimerase/dehydratase family protein n=1 Tax=Selenomonas sp. TaxID=2053611 RepID=UPI0025FD5D87|nr:NAD-dependent epimerase/dehydratase family protein [Selenomonas sp.]MCR5438414.1 GDP-mannose 4,6-dehydratase [Selenomonas sp.]